MTILAVLAFSLVLVCGLALALDVVRRVGTLGRRTPLLFYTPTGPELRP